MVEGQFMAREGCFIRRLAINARDRDGGGDASGDGKAACIREYKDARGGDGGDGES